MSIPDLKDDPLDEITVNRYLNEKSDFSFELQILELLISIGYHCEHGGTYEDPITNKPREFDIRARNENQGERISLAVECKNISPNFPLVVECTPRLDVESYHDVVFSFESDGDILASQLPEYASAIRIANPNSIYKSGEYVGKSCEQVGVRRNNAVIYSTESEIYDKWAQAVNSAYGLGCEAVELLQNENLDHDEYLTFILPVLVVPDDTLWIAKYNANGSRDGNPVKTNRCSYYINRNYFFGDNLDGIDCSVSHLEIVTKTGLAQLARHMISEVASNEIFPPKVVKAAAKKARQN